MYAYAFLLSLFVFLTTSAALPSDHPADQAQKHYEYEKMRQKYDFRKPAEQQSNVKPKIKRQTIPEEYIEKGRYQPGMFYGDRGDVLIAILNKNPQKYSNDDLKVTYGVRIQPKLVLTVCSAVTYSPNQDLRVTYDHQINTSEPVAKVDPADVTLHFMSVTRTNEVPVAQILIHPGCDNQYLYDLAILATNEPLPGSRNVWIHTAENLLFRRSLDRVVAAHVVLGKCTVPVYKRDKTWSGDIEGIGFANVYLQHWDGCSSSVCAYWAKASQEGPHDEKRCDNEYGGTRMCMKWDVPSSLCGLGMGTPVFCDVGNIHGLMGFIVTETYYCNAFDFKTSIMQGVSDGIDWIRKTLQMRQAKGYENIIPHWMQDFRANYSSGYIPRVKPKNLPTAPPPDPAVPSIRFNNFVGNQMLSVVNVYFKYGFRCLGTMVAYDLVVLPCSCLTKDPNAPEINTGGTNIKRPHPVSFIGSPQDYSVSLAVNGTFPFVNGKSMQCHELCDSHYEFDSAIMEIDGRLPIYRLAWVMTAQFELYKTLLYVTYVADAAMGSDCYWLNQAVLPYGDTNRFVDTSKPFFNVFSKTKIRFVSWAECIHIACPNNIWLQNDRARCFGPLRPLSSSLFCFESLVRDIPACSIPHGAPIFCNVEQTRGFVGFVTRAIDVLYDPPCAKRDLDNQVAVMVGIDQYLKEYTDFLWIKIMEDQVRLRHEEGQSSCQLNEPSSVLIFAVLTVTFISLHEK